MAAQTERLGLYTWTDVDLFRVGEVNENFRLLENHVDLKKSETVQSQNGSASWRVRTFYDGTVELYCRYPISATCNTANGGVYLSPDVSVLLPNNVINSITNIQLSPVSLSGYVWSVNRTPTTSNTSITFCCASGASGSSANSVDIMVKGVAASG